MKQQKIIIATDIHHFSKYVTESIGDGWRVIPGTTSSSVVISDRSTVYERYTVFMEKE